uniref:Uncharacterized protein n=1 Tax=Sexangularia sp. CB-2014 TaxID=1486929 RepID=A0A7S1VMQ5_9EUKA|eukprot:CAMPEP_0170745886 /NCGR_PEP_ID=MMETSP0437-20130122/8521_1 /TAXON_ID=0 /ORGANISM="Sexangularia sp." /LENGTH=230 /DNA_ID=CAMNT_0011084613 /DNA_START=74 /DNA_END=766 /DNA_ORIENTATION=-
MSTDAPADHEILLGSNRVKKSNTGRPGGESEVDGYAASLNPLSLFPPPLFLALGLLLITAAFVPCTVLPTGACIQEYRESLVQQAPPLSLTILLILLGVTFTAWGATSLALLPRRFLITERQLIVETLLPIAARSWNLTEIEGFRVRSCIGPWEMVGGDGWSARDPLSTVIMYTTGRTRFCCRTTTYLSVAEPEAFVHSVLRAKSAEITAPEAGPRLSTTSTRRRDFLMV